MKVTVHPATLHNPALLARLERNSGMRVVLHHGKPTLQPLPRKQSRGREILGVTEPDLRPWPAIADTDPNDPPPSAA